MQMSMSFPVTFPACREGLLCNSTLPLPWRRTSSSLPVRHFLEVHGLTHRHTQAVAVLEPMPVDVQHVQHDWVYKLRREARELQKKGDFEHAKRLLRDGLIAEPANCSLLTTLANVLGREGKADEARLVYSQAAAADPSSSVPIQVCGQQLLAGLSASTW